VGACVRACVRACVGECHYPLRGARFVPALSYALSMRYMWVAQQSVLPGEEAWLPPLAALALEIEGSLDIESHQTSLVDG